MSDLPPISYPVWRWEPWEKVTMNKGGGPERVVTDQPDPDFKPRPAGFTAPVTATGPKLWEGDDA